ncbi:DUF3822 family protein [Pedobacter sp. MC2016-14]|uniref:DUF3822 family protein n=1 Tax=Pedobacter sp. MC2016-14 TaxID=2897327 RepID=UPI001E2B6D07|nr:DUF3822 family protein [Pedobacter sp. MC2016-14]MCD0489467.1 DUF3822 family protein [Pedobacter sp. MC2016-14]
MINKKSILLVDPEFDQNATSACTLLVKASLDSFSYAIIHPASKKLLLVYDQQECVDVARNMATALKEDQYLQLPFANIKISVYTVNSIAIPNEIFDISTINSYTRYFAEESSANIYVQPHTSFGFKSIFTFRQFIEENLNACLESAKRYDHLAPTLALNRTFSGNSLFLDFTAGSFQAVYTADQKLVFYNAFEIENSEEFNYYLLLICQQLQVDQSLCNVYLSGIIHNEDSNHNVISKYFEKISLNTPEYTGLDLSLLDDMPTQYYTNLLALNLCE